MVHIFAPTAVVLDGTPEPAALLNQVASQAGLVCLWGDWFGGAVLIAHTPLTSHQASARQAALDLVGLIEQPVGDGSASLIGGGWFCALGYDLGTSSLSFYDSLIRRLPDGRWQFENLGLPDRAQAVEDARLGWQQALAEAELLSSPKSPPPAAFTPQASAGSARDQHLRGVEEAIGRIGRGDIYQVNLCTRLHADFAENPVELFGRAASALQPSYGAFAALPNRSLISLSPELFLRVRGRQVETSPIKGTAPRAAGDQSAPSLEVSTKDQAENIMIVDLMRNDLSRVCQPGTVSVDDLLSIKPHPGVWHLISTVTGELIPEANVPDLLRATFPPGSVTGAPKSAAVSAIAELEASPRGVYTGALGWASPIAGADFNVAIRTFEMVGQRLELGVGGGITVDSVPILEWQECLHKAAPLIAALGSSLDSELTLQAPQPTPAQLQGGVFESILAVDGKVLRLADHLARLDRSCRELYAETLPAELPRQLLAVVALERAPRLAVRVHARPGAAGLEITVTAAPWPARIQRSQLVPATRPGQLWRHKWVDRTALSAAEDLVGSPLFVAGDGTVLETSRGNIFAKFAGRWLTPPARDDLLPGVTRRAVLDLAPRLGVSIEIAGFGLADLTDCDAMVWTSSLSGMVNVETIALPSGVQRLRLDTKFSSAVGQLLQTN